MEDKWFHGLNFYEFDNGEVWVFVELLKMSTEAYNVQNVSRTLHGIYEEAEEEEDDDDNSTIAEMDCGVPQFVQTPTLISANTDSSFHTPGSFVCGVQGISNQFLNGGLSIPYHSGKNGKGDSQTVVTRSTDNSIKSRNSFFTAPNTSTSSATLQQFSDTSSSASKKQV